MGSTYNDTDWEFWKVGQYLLRIVVNDMQKGLFIDA